ncbi:hypothetical protein MAPG_02835 [Magnaporthiopsis poae ATCC 64411]|uniref:Uncharacterized protein n=1 Tax=Magnaporthiopsis poae (strain ATCC 64411 / 73-15) TaxID=644358 RepID=A0A0C4DSF6_MAGP6|nr:hypothetical protein MAPG_02835 [Magnaporthiopsis poae ATCC 64411]
MADSGSSRGGEEARQKAKSSRPAATPARGRRLFGQAAGPGHVRGASTPLASDRRQGRTARSPDRSNVDQPGPRPPKGTYSKRTHRAQRNATPASDHSIGISAPHREKQHKRVHGAGGFDATPTTPEGKQEKGWDAAAHRLVSTSVPLCEKDKHSPMARSEWSRKTAACT